MHELSGEIALAAKNKERVKISRVNHPELSRRGLEMTPGKQPVISDHSAGRTQGKRRERSFFGWFF
jgi:hypothetical protein